MKHTKISIIGAGSVGSTIAYALMFEHSATEICLIDINEARCHGEILDLEDTISFSPVSQIHTEQIKQAGNSDIIVIAAGKRQEPGQDRIELLEANKKIIGSILQSMQPIKKDAIIIMVTNPVDLMTYHAQQVIDHPKSHIIGSGTFLDTQRLRRLLSHELCIAEQSIHAYVLGEHGDSQFPAWSIARIAGTPLCDFNLSDETLDRIAQQTKNKAYEIIKCKGATFYGIGACVAALCRTILFDQKRITPVSCFQEQFDVCLSMPVVLGAQGVEHIIYPPLDEKENKLLEQSAATIKQYLQ